MLECNTLPITVFNVTPMQVLLVKKMSMNAHRLLVKMVANVLILLIVLTAIASQGIKVCDQSLCLYTVRCSAILFILSNLFVSFKFCMSFCIAFYFVIYVIDMLLVASISSEEMLCTLTVSFGLVLLPED